MSEKLTAALVLLGLAVAAAVVAHAASRRFGASCLVSAFVAATAFVAVDSYRLGFVDPFALIAWTSAGVISLLISAGVGLGFRAFRARGRRASREARPR